MDSGIRNRIKEDIAKDLAKDDRFMNLKNNGQREAYLQLLINKGKIMEMAKSEYGTIINMAAIMDEDDLGDSDS